MNTIVEAEHVVSRSEQPREQSSLSLGRDHGKDGTSGMYWSGRACLGKWTLSLMITVIVCVWHLVTSQLPPSGSNYFSRFTFTLLWSCDTNGVTYFMHVSLRWFNVFLFHLSTLKHLLSIFWQLFECFLALSPKPSWNQLNIADFYQSHSNQVQCR